MKKIFMSMLMMLLFALFMTGCGNDSSKKIVVGLDDQFPPMGFRDEQGNLVGFDVDLAKEAAKRMNVDIEFKPIDWDKKREELTGGNIDIIWNGLDITEERKEYMIFTKPYMQDRQILLVKHDDDQQIHSEGDLEGKVVGMQSGSTAENYFNNNKDLKSNLAGVKLYEKLDSGLDALKGGEVDVFICDEMIARYEVKTNPDRFDIIDVTTGFLTEMAVGFRKDDTELRDRVQEVFDDMVEDGTAKKISEQWFQADLIKYVHK
ncbi:MAG: amino acid ABC transporter substrate-binding protein [Quinella sp. 2Q5]|nr:amino acid ABC transporter substrate-binding protein [Quinella sp. 2Q5]